jgi:hypothetical protein
VSDAAAYAALGSAVASAVAAAAAWRTVFVARRAAREARLPDLHASIAGMNGRHIISIVNSGPGVAKQVCFVVFGETEKCIGVVPWPSGFLGPGQEINTEMMFKGQMPKVAVATVSCRDYLEFPRYWTLSSGGASSHVFRKFDWLRLRWRPDGSGSIEERSAMLLKDEVSRPDRLIEVNFGLRDVREEFEEMAKFRTGGR